MKSLRELLNIKSETSKKCTDFSSKKSSDVTYHIYKTWLKNEAPEVQQALAANKPFLKKFFTEFDNTFCKHPKPEDPMGGEIFKLNLHAQEGQPAIEINKGKIEEKFTQLNEQRKQKVNSIKEKYNKFKQEQVSQSGQQK